MKQSDMIFIAAVIIVSSAYILLSVQQVVQLSHISQTKNRVSGAAGIPRDIDVEQFKRLIKTKEISDHEADFYKPYTGSRISVEPESKKQGEQASPQNLSNNQT